MRVTLLRHATRNTYDMGDCSLNTFGQTQAEDLHKLLMPVGRFPKPTRLASSPKKRARETLTPVAVSLGLTVDIDPRLLERRSVESISDFELRIHSIVDELTNETSVSNKSGAPHIWLCSHSDWLMTAMIFIHSDLDDNESSANWRPADYRTFQIRDGLWLIDRQLSNI